MHSHASDLRDEVQQAGSRKEPEAFAAAIAADWRSAGLGPVDTALCEYAEKLTHTPAAMRAADVEGLRALGVSDESIHDCIQVVSYFNYINRIADAVHVELEPEMPPYPDEV